MYCKKCGANVQGQFCPYCGTPVTAEPQTAQPQQTEFQTAPVNPYGGYQQPAQPQPSPYGYQQPQGFNPMSETPVQEKVNQPQFNPISEPNYMNNVVTSTPTTSGDLMKKWKTMLILSILMIFPGCCCGGIITSIFGIIALILTLTGKKKYEFGDESAYKATKIVLIIGVIVLAIAFAISFIYGFTHSEEVLSMYGLY